MQLFTAPVQLGADSFALDPAIRDRVLLPLTLIVILSGVLRHVLTLLVATPPKPQPLLAVREQRAITRGQLLRFNSSHLPPSSFLALRSSLSQAYVNGSFLKAPPPKPAADGVPPNPFEDPAQMEQMLEGLQDMMKKQAVGFVPQMATMYLVNRFFSGALIARIPFPLPLKSGDLLQRGVQLLPSPSGSTPFVADASWCSTSSWYFLCMFGIGPVYQLLLGNNSSAADPAALAPPPPTMPGAPAQDMTKIFRAERENLDIVEYEWVCEGVEERLLERFGRAKA
ncbi:hypothetical protein JCM10049v2_000109 [Rhodotorula toruloides]